MESLLKHEFSFNQGDRSNTVMSDWHMTNPVMAVFATWEAASCPLFETDWRAIRLSIKPPNGRALLDGCVPIKCWCPTSSVLRRANGWTAVHV
jgi:hypothetical protein